MSMAVCKMMKMGANALGGIQIHNQREKDSKSNLDIDKSKEHLNYDLVNSEPINYNKRIRAIIDEQKTSTRKIRKDAVLVNEFIITSDKGFFDKLMPERQREFFVESTNFFQERYGKQNISHAVVHNDEHTPHMHIGVVPMRDGRLQSKNIFNRAELLYLQENFPKHLQGVGFEIERGEQGSEQEALTATQYKLKLRRQEVAVLESEGTVIKQKVEELESASTVIKQEVAGLAIESKVRKQEISELESKREVRKQEILKLELKKKELLEQVENVELDKLDVKESNFFGSKTVKMPSESFEQVKALALVSEPLKIENKRLKTKISSLEEKYDHLEIRYSALKSKNEVLQKENGTLKVENSRLKRTIGWIQENVPEAIRRFHAFFASLGKKEKEQEQQQQSEISQRKEHKPSITERIEQVKVKSEKREQAREPHNQKQSLSL